MADARPDRSAAPDLSDYASPAPAGARVVLVLWGVVVCCVGLAYALAWRAQATGNADEVTQEAIVVEPQSTVILVVAIALLALVLTAALLARRWVARCARNVAALGGTGRSVLALWAAGGQAPAPRMITAWRIVTPCCAALPVLIAWPDDYDALTWLDPASIGATAVVLASALLGIGVVRLVSERHEARAAHLAADGEDA